MAKFNFYLATGHIGAEWEEEIEIPDEDLKGLEGVDREKEVEEWYQEWVDGHLEKWWTEIEN